MVKPIEIVARMPVLRQHIRSYNNLQGKFADLWEAPEEQLRVDLKITMLEQILVDVLDSLAIIEQAIAKADEIVESYFLRDVEKQLGVELEELQTKTENFCPLKLTEKLQGSYDLIKTLKA